MLDYFITDYIASYDFYKTLDLISKDLSIAIYLL